MIWLYTLLAALGGGLLLTLAVVLILYNLKRVRIIDAAARASEEQLHLIYDLIEQSGSEGPRGCVLARTNQRVADRVCVLTIPDSLEKFPWAGRTIAVDAGSEVTFRFTFEKVAAPQFLGKVYRPVGVPRFRLKSGKVRASFLPENCVSNSDALRQALEKVCPRYPVDLLSYLLCGGAETFEFEAFNSALIGGRPEWVQDAEFPECDECKNRMALILQVPGTMLARGAYGESTFYFFGCKRHPEHTKTVGQWS
jgi:hypothetical protein